MAYLTQSNVAVPPFKVKRAAIKQLYNIFPGDINKFVVNVFDVGSTKATLPLFGVRLLQLLEDARRTDRHNPFLSLSQVIEYSRAMGSDDEATRLWLDMFLRRALCQSYDPTITNLSDIERVELTASGYQHLRWSLGDVTYLDAMLEITPLSDPDVFDRMKGSQSLRPTEMWQAWRRAFVQHLVEEDVRFCQVPVDFEAFEGQRKLSERFRYLGQATNAPVVRDARKSLSRRPHRHGRSVNS